MSPLYFIASCRTLMVDHVDQQWSDSPANQGTLSKPGCALAATLVPADWIARRQNAPEHTKLHVKIWNSRTLSIWRTIMETERIDMAWAGLLHVPCFQLMSVRYLQPFYRIKWKILVYEIKCISQQRSEDFYIISQQLFPCSLQLSWTTGLAPK